MRGIRRSSEPWGKCRMLGVCPKLVWRHLGPQRFFRESLSHCLARKERDKLVWML